MKIDVHSSSSINPSDLSNARCSERRKLAIGNRRWIANVIRWKRLRAIYGCCTRSVMVRSSGGCWIEVSHHRCTRGENRRERLLQLFLLLSIFGSSILKPDLFRRKKSGQIQLSHRRTRFLLLLLNQNHRIVDARANRRDLSFPLVYSSDDQSLLVARLHILITNLFLRDRGAWRHDSIIRQHGYAFGSLSSSFSLSFSPSSRPSQPVNHMTRGIDVFLHTAHHQPESELRSISSHAPILPENKYQDSDSCRMRIRVQRVALERRSFGVDVGRVSNID